MRRMVRTVRFSDAIRNRGECLASVSLPVDRALLRSHGAIFGLVFRRAGRGVQ
jgi:hypothetical protein